MRFGWAKKLKGLWEIAQLGLGTSAQLAGGLTEATAFPGIVGLVQFAYFIPPPNGRQGRVQIVVCCVRRTNTALSFPAPM